MRALSLFSGAGGDTHGLESAGISVVGFVEWEKPMIRTHIANFPNSILIGRDICAVTADQLAPYIDNIDIIFAGFPCQGMSKAGKKDPNDKRNNLFKEFVRITDIVKPLWIIGENVKHILKMKTPEDVNTCDMIIHAFEEIGYTMAAPHVLKAHEFGAPQKRERCFFVGSRNDTNFSWDRVHEIGRSIPERHLSDILETEIDMVVEITDEQAAHFGITHWVYGEDLGEPRAPAPLNLRKCIESGELSFGKRVSPNHSEVVNPNGFSKTLICTYNRMPRMFVPIQCGATSAKFLRPYTVNEAKQIQGFPANYIITGNRMEAIKQIGNAVPPPLVKAIATVIMSSN